jgi:putative RNA 2'-phosphotransferase
MGGDTMKKEEIVKKVKAALNAKKKKSLSKYLGWVLRHEPEAVGLTLDKEGWVKLDDLIKAIEKHEDKYKGLTKEDLKETVEKHSGGRYVIQGDKIRATSSHNKKLDVDVFDKDVKPPKYLYHGTTEESWEAGIKDNGLKAMSRKFVNLADTPEYAMTKGERWKGKKPMLLKVDSEKMSKDGYKFYYSDTNKIWSVEEVPLKYISKY